MTIYASFLADRERSVANAHHGVIMLEEATGDRISHTKFNGLAYVDFVGQIVPGGRL